MKFLATLFLLGSAGVSHAETNLDRGKRIVDDCIKALGGEAFLHMQNRVEEGRAYSFYREQVTGLTIAKVYTRYVSGVTDTAHTLAIESREFYGKKQDSSVLFGQNEAYELTYRGARPITSDRFARYKETMLRNVLYILRIRLHEPGMLFESRGSEVLSNRPVEIVDIIDSQNLITTVYFDQTTKLPLRQIFFRRDAVTREKDEEVTEFSKYRDVGGGAMWPFDTHRERNREKIYELFSESGESNKNVADNLFRLPSSIKVLKSQ